MFLLAMFFFKRQNETFEANNLALINSLASKNKEIEKKTEDLEQANLEINLINEQLSETVDDRTEKLIKQAIVFQKFSFKNSHELRAPVAKVMAILDLLKTVQTETDRNDLLQKLEMTCVELDAIVSEINQLLDTDGYMEQQIPNT